MCLRKILNLGRLHPSTPDTEGYRIYKVGRESFIYEEPERKARIVGEMLIGGDTNFAFRLRDAILHWETSHGNVPISTEEKRAIFTRFDVYMQKTGVTYELEE